MIVTLLLIGVTAVVSFLALNRAELAQRLLLWPPAVQRGQAYRLLSYGLVHADLQHLLFNMITLFFFGRAIEGFFASRIGEAGFALFYASALIISIAPSYLRHRRDAAYMSLGASGAVSAVLFAFVMLAPWSLIFVFVLPLPAIVYAAMYIGYSVYMQRRGNDNVNHSAHLWGGLYGAVFTLIMEPRVGPVFLARLLHPSFG